MGTKKNQSAKKQSKAKAKAAVASGSGHEAKIQEFEIMHLGLYSDADLAWPPDFTAEFAEKNNVFDTTAAGGVVLRRGNTRVC